MNKLSDTMFFKKSNNNDRPIIIGLCGRSCSGKSVIIRKIEEKYPNKVLRIPLDRFFKISISNKLIEKYGWESPESLRWDRLIYSVNKLKNNESTHIPSKGWTENFDQLVNPKKIIIVEGYLIFTNSELLKLFDYKIFFDVSDLNILYRRTLRDNTIDNMQYTMEKVIPISKKYEGNQKGVADVVIDGNKPKNEVLKEVEDYIKDYL